MGRILFLTALLFVFSAFFPASGATWYVDGSVPASGDGTSWEKALKTIQEGINASSDGDTVLVAEGTYIENIKFNGKNITLTSTDPLDSTVVANTVIDGNQAGSVVTFSGTEDETCTLSGFTIQDGSVRTASGICGGTSDDHTRAIIESNLITGNRTDWYGGGVSYCDGAILNNTIRNNSAYWGAGLYDCDGTIQDNLITMNRSDGGGAGLDHCDGTIQYNEVSSNSGRGLCECNGTIQGNVVSDNESIGLLLCDGTVRRNTITRNAGCGLARCSGVICSNLIALNNPGWEGGGLSSCYGTLVNNTIYGNSADAGGGLFECTGDIRNCIIWGNTAKSSGDQMENCSVPCFSCIQAWDGTGNGNISENPLFVDPAASDFRLRASSPCIDAGANGFWFTWPQSDRDGNSRLAGSRTDMGCYEYASSSDTDGDLVSDAAESAIYGTNPSNEDTDKDGLRDGLEIIRGSNPLSVTLPGILRVRSDIPTIQEALCVALQGDEIIVAPGTYYENLRFLGSDVILRSLNPGDRQIIASTVMDGGRGGPLLIFSGAESEACVLAGFTVRNNGPRSVTGSYGVRGTICGRGTYATIRNNVITRNDDTGVCECNGPILGNVITDNSAQTGGGLYWCRGLIRNNLIYGNSARDYGGGLCYCNGTIENNTIYGNLEGGGLYACKGLIRNCIIWGNDDLYTPQLAPDSNATYCCIEDWEGEGDGNISVSPHFVDRLAGDLHLQSWSPCIDSGDPSSDFSNEPLPNGARINMGAYGNTPEAASASKDGDSDSLPDDWETHFLATLDYGPSDDPDADGLSNEHEYRNGVNPAREQKWFVDASASAPGNGETWQTPFTTIQIAIDTATDGDTITVAPGTYLESIRLRGKNIVLRSTHLTDPDAIANTVIQGDESGAVVSFSRIEDESCVLAGFTIRGGKAGIGGGGTHATIRNNVITANSGQGIGWCNGLIENSTITANAGGSLKDCDAVIRNCIIWDNDTVSVLWYSSRPIYCCIEGWSSDHRGNIGCEPYFLHAENGDYRLKNWSPCIDAGDPLSDFANEPQPNGGRVNMGAYGNTRWATPKSPDADLDGLPDDWEMELLADMDQTARDDPDHDLVSNMREYLWGFDPMIGANVWHVDASLANSRDGRSWATAFRSIQEGIDAASDGDTVIVAAGTYVENTRFEGKNIVLTSRFPLGHAVVTNTIIDGRGSASVVTFSGSENGFCTLSGFTIRNGSAHSGTAFYGGGVLGGSEVFHTHATMENNVVTGNWAHEGGGLVFCDGVIRNNLIAGNTADGWGGGLCSCNGVIENNTIVGNSVTGFVSPDQTWTPGEGAGLCGCGGAILNCIIWQNTGDGGRQLRFSSEPTSSCVQEGAGEGNIAEDPRFADPDGLDGDPGTAADNDYRLLPDSPCIDVGSDEEWMWDGIDLDGNPRIWNGTVDMGAYEYGSFPFRVVGVVGNSGGSQLTWTSCAGDTYTVWSCEDLLVGSWTEEGTVASGGETTVWSDPDTTSSRKFYRIEAH